MENISPAVAAALIATAALREPAARCAVRVFVCPPVRSVIVFVLVLVLVFVFVLVLIFFFVLIVLIVLLVLLVLRTAR